MEEGFKVSGRMKKWLAAIAPTINKVGGQAVLGRQSAYATPWLTERHGYDPTFGWSLSNRKLFRMGFFHIAAGGCGGRL